MTRSIQITLLVCLMVLSACSRETWKRTGYETLQNVGREQCEKERAPDCPPPGSYDTYKQKRDEAQSR